MANDRQDNQDLQQDQQGHQEAQEAQQRAEVNLNDLDDNNDINDYNGDNMEGFGTRYLSPFPGQRGAPYFNGRMLAKFLRIGKTSGTSNQTREDSVVL